MDANEIDLRNFVGFLLNITNCGSLTELSDKMGISRVTFNHWQQGNVKNMKPSTRKKLREFFDENPEWGIKLGMITNSKIEIVNSGRDSTTSKQSTKDDDLLKEVLKENFQLKKENDILKEKLEKYEVKK